jgi:hypothetical protein
MRMQNEVVVVEVVLVIDTSQSMQPCIEQLKRHLRSLVSPVQKAGESVRFGLVGLGASRDDQQGLLFRLDTLPGGVESLGWLYGGTTQHEFFTADESRIAARIDSLSVTGDEDNLLALDIALDHPFGPLRHTKRVVALFGDEKLEDGVRRNETVSFIPKLIEKLHARHIKLFAALPESPALWELSQASGSEIEVVAGGSGLATVDFRALLDQMGKSISSTSLANASEERFERALFGQDQWQRVNTGWNSTDR